MEDKDKIDYTNTSDDIEEVDADDAIDDLIEDNNIDDSVDIDNEEEAPIIGLSEGQLKEIDERYAINSGLVPEAILKNDTTNEKNDITNNENHSWKFDNNELWHRVMIKCKNESIRIAHLSKYTKAVNYLLTTTRLNRLPDICLLLGAPNDFYQEGIAYECIMNLMKNNHKCVPYVSLLELSYIRSTAENVIMEPYKVYDQKKATHDIRNREYIKNKGFVAPIYKDITMGKANNFLNRELTKQYNYFDYVNADCLFTYFSGIGSKEVESYELLELLNIRGSKMLPTIVFTKTSDEKYKDDPRLLKYVIDETLMGQSNTDVDKIKRRNVYNKLYHISCYWTDNDNSILSKDSD